MFERMMRWFLFVLLFVACRGVGLAETTGLTRREWQVEGVSREALIHLPAKDVAQAPVVLVFHGHGGNMRQASRGFGMEKWWPEAVVVYPQGLNTPGRLTDPEGRRPGWQHAAGDQGDRDLKFFDEVIALLKREKLGDTKKVFVTGHSNGGAFTYLLWAERGEQLMAVAPSAAIAPRGARDLAPKPAMHVAGEADPLVRYAWQKVMMQTLLKVNQAEPEGKTWQGHGMAKLHESKVSAPTVLVVHPGGHELLEDAPKWMAEFFKERLKEKS